MIITRRNGILATIAAGIIWSTGGVFIKILPQDAYTILFFRSVYAAILFALLFGKQSFRVNKISLISSLSYTGVLIFFVLATKLTTAANAIFLQYTAPAFVLLLEPWLLKTKLTKVNVLTVFSSFVGMALFFLGDLSSPDNWMGIVFGLGSGICLTIFILAQRMNNPDFHSSGILYGNILVVLMTLPFISGVGLDVVNNHLILLFLGFGQIGLGYVLFSYGQRYLTAIESSLIALLEPILNPIWVILWYGEVPGPWAIIGGSIIVTSLIVRIIVMERLKRQSQLKETPSPV